MFFSMRTTLDLPDPLFRELKIQAARQGINMKDLLARYVEAGLYGRFPAIPGSSVPRRSPIPIARHATGQTIPAMSNARMQQILDEDDAGH